MTWIAAFPSVGLSLMVSDTRVSRETPDGDVIAVENYRLQKIHALSDQLVVGFAGNVTQGFRALSMIELLIDHAELRSIEQIESLLTDFATRAANLTPPLFPLELVAIGVEDIGMAASASDAGFELMQGAAWKIVPRSGEISRCDGDPMDPSERLLSIGSGSHVAAWQDAAGELASDPNFLMKFAFSASQGDQGAMLAVEVTSLLQRTLPFQKPSVQNSVSDNLYLSAVSHFGVIESTNIWVSTDDDQLPLIRTPEDHRLIAGRFAHDAHSLLA